MPWRAPTVMDERASFVFEGEPTDLSAYANDEQLEFSQGDRRRAGRRKALIRQVLVRPFDVTLLSPNEPCG